MENLKKTLKGIKIQFLIKREPHCVPRGTPIETVIRRMEEMRIGNALILDGEKLAGIFTERDVMTRVVEPGIDGRTPIEKVMTERPKTLKVDDTVADAIRLMSRGGYRHIPIVDGGGKVVGSLSVKVLVSYLAEHFPCQVYNLPPDPHQIQRSPEGA